MTDAIKSFGAMLSGQGNICIQLGKALCHRLSVPYHEAREEERLLGHRLREVPAEEALKQGLLPTRRFKFPDGRVLDQEEFPPVDLQYDTLTEEVWSHDNTPDSYNDVTSAVQKCSHGITGVYYHRPSMNLVLVNAAGEKIGIRSTALVVPLVGLREDEARLLGKLRRAETS